ncbi:ectoine/hydroxyectoine ABC transporter substrate-binding protein EhuB [Pusillimonas sp.]|uniref:ectoine/hydroxyectoine ABC transporter substrate-binding protein EhuB n=1 Tax=Pusillimonas sp. TaxID=3040095 RepID=UPI0029BB3538|nr:ectoine/hydroxyectoine ABC transporter substrate-binding protein EhuB [Pusillimonas sp.]MDX3896093.1 ectoine/hydroxyectoine ABC transporter substrate-binding protein EhuB [Pusillimonas sp.]
MAMALLAGAAGLAQAVTLEQIKKRGSLRIAVANEIPYGYMDLRGKPQGVGPDVAQHVAKQLGIKKIEWISTTFSALIPGLRAKRFDMVAAEMAILPQRCGHVLFSQPNSSYGEGLLVAKGNPKNIHSFEHFARSQDKVAIMAGADQLEMMQAVDVPQERMVTISSNSDAISTVATGRAGAYAATSATIHQLAGKDDRVEAAAEFTDPVIDGEPVRSWGAFTFNTDSKDLVRAVDEELARFKQTEAWRQIMSRHGFSEADAEESFERTREQLCAAH